jgi:UDP-glucose 4-epimerase
MRILVTGAAGFIGKHLARRLTLLPEVELWTLDRREVPIPGANAIVGDLAELDLGKELPDLDLIYHLSAQTSARVSHEAIDEELRDNVVAPLRLLEFCRNREVPRIVFASSMGVYGNTEGRVREEAVPCPTSIYGAHKLLVEKYLEVYRQFGVRSTVLRLFNVYGPEQSMHNLKQGMVSIYLRYVMDGVEVPVTGSLDRFRDFIYIDDVVEAFLLAMREPNMYDRTFNVGSGKSTTVRDLIRLIGVAWGHPEPDYPVRVVEGHAGDVLGNVASIDKIVDFGWESAVPLAEGLKRFVDWAKDSGKIED